MNVYQKIQNCRVAIKASDLQKLGYNSYSEYYYYTPEQVDKLVYEACTNENLFVKFELVRDLNGLFGQLTVYNLDDIKDFAVFVAATEMPTITATNASQQMGGCMTFTERYLKQTTFSIVNNDLDFDAQKPQGKKQAQKKKDDNKPWLNEDTPNFNKAKEYISKGGSIKDIRKKYKVSRKIEEMLLGTYRLPEPGPNE